MFVPHDNMTVAHRIFADVNVAPYVWKEKKREFRWHLCLHLLANLSVDFFLRSGPFFDVSSLHLCPCSPSICFSSHRPHAYTYTGCEIHLEPFCYANWGSYIILQGAANESVFFGPTSNCEIHFGATFKQVKLQRTCSCVAATMHCQRKAPSRCKHSLLDKKNVGMQ